MKYHQPYGITDPNAPYINGNPATGTMGSIPPAASIEYPQREIVNFITDSGITPDDGDLRQLGKSVQSNQVCYCDDQGTVNQVVVTLAPAVTVLKKGMVFVCASPTGNTGPSTLKVNSLPPVPIVHSSDQTALVAGDIQPNCLNAYGFDGANFQMVWSQKQAAPPGPSGGGGGGPIYLAAPTTWYVNAATGDDTYDGLTAAHTTGIHGPFKTLQKAANQIPLYNLNGYGVTINVADGAYNAVVFGPVNGSGTITVNGDTANPAACSIFGGVSIGTMCLTTFRGFKITTDSSPNTVCISAGGGGTVLYMDYMEFGACAFAQINIGNNALVTNIVDGSPYKISGSAAYFINCSRKGHWMGSSATVHGVALNIVAAVNYSQAFINCDEFSLTEFMPQSITGYANVSGQKYIVRINSCILCGGSPSYYPGTVAGYSEPTISGGYYL